MMHETSRSFKLVELSFLEQKYLVKFSSITATKQHVNIIITHILGY